MEEKAEDILRGLNDTEINSVEEFEQVENNSEKENEHHGRLYWISKNIRKKLSSWFSNHKLFGFLLLLTIFIAAFYLRAYIHPLTLTIRKYFVLILLLAVVYWFFRRSIRKKEKFISRLFWNIILIGILAGGYFFGPPVYKYMGLYYHFKTMDKKFHKRKHRDRQIGDKSV